MIREWYVDFFSIGQFTKFIYAFSLIDPGEPFGVIHTFPSIVDALEFATFTYKASSHKYISTGMIQEEYRDYIKR